MIWRSVVGKLWGTILLLVSVVLFILTVLLMQFFENFIVDNAKKQLSQLEDSLVEIIQSDQRFDEAKDTVSSLVDAHSSNIVILSDRTQYSHSSEQTDLSQLPYSLFREDPELSKVLENGETVSVQGDFPIQKEDQTEHNEILIVGKPVQLSDNERGAVFIYQSLELIEETNQKAKQIIFLSAGIAIILTTIFAFFLSTRITSPLRRMREAALEVTQGKFDTKVPILTHDEIGELALSFNRMGRNLKNNINALSQEKEQLSSILSSMADGVITFDRKGKILVTNPPAERFIRAWYYEQGMEERVGEEVPEQINDLFRNVVSLEREQMTEIDLQGRSWVVLMTPLYNQSNVRGAVAVFRDMTEERQHDKLRKDFIANVSHELRTPISMLQGYSEAIIDDIAGTEQEKKDIAQIIYDESLRMGRLVNELLDLARMEAGHVSLELIEIDVREFFTRVVHKFQGLAREREIDIKLILPETAIGVEADADRLEQVMTNLIDNALRHTQKGGTVTVEVTNLLSGLNIDIKDTGSGIPKEDLPFVFERFYKADKARTRGRSGTGLGLAIVKNIIDAHGGKISVHSKIDEGTTFSFFIPQKNKNENGK
ncbi:ATP-binding protein [Pseudalkalibacillus salsuginis]|uniref:ATP-binding protein n=1 Tax=Pseudalkalibacillus salsuginis TaxID=2910972 RepID=UPI001F45133D|nr:ATP-binding protein [Pseudalkalibacillus salsuginis]MCF6408271.1 cell wall metabolism sensor histidine kinase WalK [Pseudalkalibacillus salsuginis]